MKEDGHLMGKIGGWGCVWLQNCVMEWKCAQGRLGWVGVMRKKMGGGSDSINFWMERTQPSRSGTEKAKRQPLKKRGPFLGSRERKGMNEFAHFQIFIQFLGRGKAYQLGEAFFVCFNRNGMRQEAIGHYKL